LMSFGVSKPMGTSEGVDNRPNSLESFTVRGVGHCFGFQTNVGAYCCYTGP
jgi:hypothetical protein